MSKVREFPHLALRNGRMPSSDSSATRDAETSSAQPPDLAEIKQTLEIAKLWAELKSSRRRRRHEAEKLRLEVEALRSSFRRTLATAVLTAAVSVLIATGGWLLDRSKTRENDRRAERQQREEAFAHALETFSSSRPDARISGVIVLKRMVTQSDESVASAYADQTIATLVARLATEEDQAVTHAIIDALVEIGPRALDDVIYANRRAATALARATGRTVVLRTAGRDQPAQSRAALERLAAHVRWIAYPLEEDERGAIRRGLDLDELMTYTLSPSYQAARRENNGDLREAPAADHVDFSHALAAVDSSTRFLISTSEILTRLIAASSNRLGGKKLDGIVITWGDLHGVNLSGASLRRAYLRANFRHANFSNADLSYADLRGAVLDSARLTGATLTRTQFDTWNLDSTSLLDFTGTNWWDAVEHYYNPEDPALHDSVKPLDLEAEFPRRRQEQLRAASMPVKR